MPHSIQELKKALPDIQENVSLADYSNFQVGGPAKFFYVARTNDDLAAALKAAHGAEVPYLVLGKGTNLLISDSGFDGLVIKNEARELDIDGTTVTVDGGYDLATLLTELNQKSLGGLEYMAGIPSSLGGAVRGNAGAWGHNIGERVTEVEVFVDGEIKTLSAAECEFAYRDSAIKRMDGAQVLRVTLDVQTVNADDSAEEMRGIMAKRDARMPQASHCAGCVFKNIELDKIDVDRDKVIKALDVGPEDYDRVTRFGKLPTGWVIEKLGFSGKKIGGAVVSDKHCAYILNDGTATAEHIVQLISDIKMRVRNGLGIQLEEEIQLVGF